MYNLFDIEQNRRYFLVLMYVHMTENLVWNKSLSPADCICMDVCKTIAFRELRKTLRGNRTQRFKIIFLYVPRSDLIPLEY